MVPIDNEDGTYNATTTSWISTSFEGRTYRRNSVGE
jgi:hypothetical protein